ASTYGGPAIGAWAVRPIPRRGQRTGGRPIGKDPGMSRMDTITKTMNRTHRIVWKLSGHRLLTKPFGMPAVELHTTGRKSGKRRTVILTSPIHDDTKVVVIASKGGDDRHPDWYTNLLAQPDV